MSPARQPAASGPVRFEGLVESPPDGIGAYVCVPFDVLEVFGTRGRVPVAATLNGFAHRGSIVPMGKGGGPGAHLLGLSKKIRSEAGLSIGDQVEVILERDDRPRTVAPPADLATALRKAPVARKAWQQLSYTHQREHVEAIEEARKPETRQRRIAKCLEMLLKKTTR